LPPTVARRKALSHALITAAILLAGMNSAPAPAADHPTLRLAAFNVDATPPLGSPVAYAPARSITDPLSARGIVLLGAGQPIVLCAVDWIGIGGSGQDEWKTQLAAAAGTTPDRISVHTLHQHDAPRCDFRAEELLAAHGLGGTRFDAAFARRVIADTAKAVKHAAENASPVTHLGLGSALVERAASNRRILGPDGKVALTRMSSCRNPDAIAAPEGTIDPALKLISFWNDQTPLAILTWYACHPQSYYGKGDVTPSGSASRATSASRNSPGRCTSTSTAPAETSPPASTTTEPPSADRSSPADSRTPCAAPGDRHPARRSPPPTSNGG
jgi:hypothetical protein